MIPIPFEKERILENLIKYTELNEIASNAYNEKDFEEFRKNRKLIEVLHEEKLLPSLEFIEDYFCEKKDEEILACYIEMLEVIGNSASEAPRWTFGNMYICHPELVLDYVKLSRNKKQVYIDLSFGFENVIYYVDTTNINLEGLKKGIESIMDSKF